MIFFFPITNTHIAAPASQNKESKKVKPILAHINFGYQFVAVCVFSSSSSTIQIMPLIDTIETHFFGPRRELLKWTFTDYAIVAAKLWILSMYIVFEAKVSTIRRVSVVLVNSKPFDILLHLVSRLSLHIPLIGHWVGSILPRMKNLVNETIIPRLDFIINAIQTVYQLHMVEMTFKDKKNVHIFVTGESESLELELDGRQLTTLLISNHRSINDYALINYLIQSNGKSSNSNTAISKLSLIKGMMQGKATAFQQIRFLGWAKMVNFPSISFFKNIFSKDENAAIQPSKIKNFIRSNGNQTLVIFPEVNIMTTELSMIQRKLNQDYPFVAKFYNVLYPRFKNFTNVMRVFANINNVQQDTKTRRILQDLTVFNRMDRIFSKLAPEKAEEQNNAIIKQNDQPAVFGTTASEIALNKYMYNLTLVYYRPRFIEMGHDHDKGNLEAHNGYQLEQINPSLLELLRPDLSDAKRAPIIIMVSIHKHELYPLLTMKNNKLEKWLDTQWIKKDSLIASIENGIKMK